jgi:hypothetical protein
MRNIAGKARAIFAASIVLNSIHNRPAAIFNSLRLRQYLLLSVRDRALYNHLRKSILGGLAFLANGSTRLQEKLPNIV